MKVSDLINELGKHPDIYETIDNTPEADVVEVRHGHWVEDGEYQVCSECGEEHHWDEYRATYCEDCGAKMDREKKQKER